MSFAPLVGLKQVEPCGEAFGFRNLLNAWPGESLAAATSSVP